MAKLSFLAGFGAGYVLGARAGRERYEQIVRAWEHAKDDPRMQSVAGMAQARADAVVGTLKSRMGGNASASRGGGSTPPAGMTTAPGPIAAPRTQPAPDTTKGV